MKERPILFSAPMVRALLAGTKTQTRRIVKDSAWRDFGDCDSDGKLVSSRDIDRSLCHYGQPGDHLWVRETWQYYDWTEDGEPKIRYAADNATAWVENIHDLNGWPERLVDIWAGLSEESNYAIDGAARDRKWRPSIYMPRWASRITLEVTEVRAQRLQDISEPDIYDEGAITDEWLTWRDDVHTYAPPGSTIQNEHGVFQVLWESINGPDSWDANPWVWAITFKRLAP